MLRRLGTPSFRGLARSQDSTARHIHFYRGGHSAHPTISTCTHALGGSQLFVHIFVEYYYFTTQYYTPAASWPPRPN